MTTKILICKVLVAKVEYRGYQTAKGGQPASDLRVTTVDNIQNPRIFVNRLPHSFRPEYILEMIPNNITREIY